MHIILAGMAMLTISSVWTTRTTQHTRLKTASESCVNRLKHMAPTPTWNWQTISPAPVRSKRCCVASATTGGCIILAGMAMLTISSVWTTRTTQHTRLKTASESCVNRVKHMSPTPTWNWQTISPAPVRSKRCCVASATTGGCKNLYSATWST